MVCMGEIMTVVIKGRFQTIYKRFDLFSQPYLKDEQSITASLGPLSQP